MIVAMFDYPLPNNGERYDLSQEEWVNLFQKAYNTGYTRGFETAGIQYDQNYTKTNAIGEWISDWR